MTVLPKTSLSPKTLCNKRLRFAKDQGTVEIKNYASTLAAFYTLWAIIVLHRGAIGEPLAFAALFSDFGRRIQELNSAPDAAPFLRGRDAIKNRYALEFLEASRGASTDLTPRQKRFDALVNFIAAQ